MKTTNYEKIARNLWPDAEWITGKGQFALIAPCGVMTVSLHKTEEAAKVVKGQIDSCGCGGQCEPLRVASHQIINLDSIIPRRHQSIIHPIKPRPRSSWEAWLMNQREDEQWLDQWLEQATKPRMISQW